MALAMAAAFAAAGCATGTAAPPEEPQEPSRPTPTASSSRPHTRAPTVAPTPVTTIAPNPSEASLGAAPQGETEAARVVAVVDGDTIKVDRGRGVESVRYIGVDTPETVHPSRPVEWMGKEASDLNRQLVEGREVFLERDVSETDRYGRLLRYVWIRDGDGWMFVNLALVVAGVGQVVTYPPDVRYVDLYLDAQREAREQGRGLWGEPTSAPPIATEPPARGDCDPAYPTVCIPAPPPDLDCGDIPYRRFEVLPPDPHRFDGNKDGVGCES